MPGQIKSMIDTMVNKHSKGDSITRRLILTKLFLKGINHRNFDESSADDPSVIAKLQNIEKDLEKLY